MLDKLRTLLEENLFVFMGDVSESGYTDEDFEHYKDWSIYLDFPNGGLTAVDLIHRPSGLWFGRPTENEWDYDQDEEVTAFAKETIDWIEQELNAAPGQMELLQSGSDRNA